MKRSFVLMIGLILTMGMVIGCGESGDGGGKSNTPNDNKNDPTGGKVVAVQYRGTYIIETPVAPEGAAKQFELTANKVIETTNGNDVIEYPEAYTENNKLYSYPSQPSLWGYFEEGNKFILTVNNVNRVFIKQ